MTNVIVNASAMAGTRAAVSSDHSLMRIWPGRQLHGGSEVAMKLPAASSHVVSVGKTARCSGEAVVVDFGQAGNDSSNSVLEIAVANTAAAAVDAAVSDPAAVRRQIAVAEMSAGIAVFAGTEAFAVAAAGSSAAAAAAADDVMEGRIVVVGGYNSAEHVAATEPDDFADCAVAVGLRRKVRPWVAAAASGRPRWTSAPGRTPHIAHSQPVGRPRMEAA